MIEIRSQKLALVLIGMMVMQNSLSLAAETQSAPETSPKDPYLQPVISLAALNSQSKPVTVVEEPQPEQVWMSASPLTVSTSTTISTVNNYKFGATGTLALDTALDANGKVTVKILDANKNTVQSWKGASWSYKSGILTLTDEGSRTLFYSNYGRVDGTATFENAGKTYQAKDQWVFNNEKQTLERNYFFLDQLVPNTATGGTNHVWLVRDQLDKNGVRYIKFKMLGPSNRSIVATGNPATGVYDVTGTGRGDMIAKIQLTNVKLNFSPSLYVESFTGTDAKGEHVVGGLKGDNVFLKYNHIPVAAPATVKTLKNTVLAAALTATDEDTTDTLTLSIGTPPAHGAVTLLNGKYTYTPAKDFVGTDFFTYRVHDGWEYSTEVKIAITIEAPKLPPPPAPAPSPIVNRPNPTPEVLPEGVWTYQDFVDGKIGPKAETFVLDEAKIRQMFTGDLSRALENIRISPEAQAAWKRALDSVNATPILNYGPEDNLMNLMTVIELMDKLPNYTYKKTKDQLIAAAFDILFNQYNHLTLGTNGDQRTMVGVNLLSLSAIATHLQPYMTEAQKARVTVMLKEQLAHPYVVEGRNSSPDLGMHIALALVLYDKEAGTAAVNSIYQKWWDPTHEIGEGPNLANMIKRQGLYNEGEGYFQRQIPLFYGLMAFQDATGLDYASHIYFFRKWPEWIAQAVAQGTFDPDNLKVSLDIIMTNGGNGSDSFNLYDIPMMGRLTARMLKNTDPKAAALAQAIGDIHFDMVKTPLARASLVSLLAADFTVKSQTPEELGIPLATVFQGQGNGTIRSGWDSYDTMIRYNKVRWTDFRSGRTGLSLMTHGAKLFTATHNLANHDYHSGAAASTPTFYRPKSDGTYEIMEPIHYTSMQSAVEAEGKYDTGVMEFDSVEGVYSFMEGTNDMYEIRTTPPAATTRSLIYFPPANGEAEFLLIRDTYTGDASWLPHSVFHITEPPVVTGSSSSAEVFPGQMLYTGATQIRVTDDGFNYRGTGVTSDARAYVNLLTPAQVMTIGGTENFADEPYRHITNTTENKGVFTNSINASPDYRRQRGGEYRFDLIPQGEGPTKSVLTAIQLTSATDNNPVQTTTAGSSSDISAVYLGTSRLFIGAKVAGSPVLSGSMKAAMTGTVQFLMTDLKPNTDYRLSVNGRVQTVKSNAAGILSLPSLQLAKDEVLQFQAL